MRCSMSGGGGGLKGVVRGVHCQGGALLGSAWLYGYFSSAKVKSRLSCRCHLQNLMKQDVVLATLPSNQASCVQHTNVT